MRPIRRNDRSRYVRAAVLLAGAVMTAALCIAWPMRAMAEGDQDGSEPAASSQPAATTDGMVAADTQVEPTTDTIDSQTQGGAVPDAGAGQANASASVELSAGTPDEDYGRYTESPDAETPPDPRHMWDDGGSGDSGILLLASNNPYWMGSGSQKSFYNGYGELFASPAYKVVDVSSWQGRSINWQAARADGVDAAILRIGYGAGNEDTCFSTNLSGVRRNGIPYGVYLYSYAYDESFAREEANWTADLLDKYGCNDLSFPVYYDLEAWTWTGHTCPSDPATYSRILKAYVDTMAARGYTDVNVYTGRWYLQNPLNDSSIWARTSWIAEYGASLQVTNSVYTGSQRGWQYTSSKPVSGIADNVDISAFTAIGTTGADAVNVTSLPSIDLPDGTYYINSVLKDSSSVDIVSGGKEDGAKTQLYAYNHSDAQRFKFSWQSDGSYVITNVNSGKVLDVANGSASNGAEVRQWTPNGSAAQKWYVRDSGSGYYVQSALGNWVLNITGANTASGASITLYAPSGTDAQKFVMAQPSDIQTGVSVALKSAIDSAYTLDIDAASKVNGAAVQLYEWNGTDAQLYEFEEVGNGVYSIVNVNSGKAVEVASGLTDNGAAVKQYDVNGTPSQHWAIRAYGDGSYALVGMRSGKAMDVSAGVAANGKRMQIYDANGTKAQRWTIERHESLRKLLDAEASASKGLVEPGTYEIEGKNGNAQVLDVLAASFADGANVQTYERNGTNAQRWHVTVDETGYLTLTNVASGKVLDISAASTDDGANVQQWTSNGSYAQKWIPRKNADGSITLLSALKEDFALDVWCAGTASGTNVDVYAANGSDAQRFAFNLVGN